MKTKRLKPVLLESDTWQPLILSPNKNSKLFNSKKYPPMKEMGDKYMQLVFIDENDNFINNGDYVFSSIDCTIGKVGNESGELKEHFSKVVASIDPSLNLPLIQENYLDTFIKQCNSNTIEDIEIEMVWISHSH